jgi:hypothetical protein
MKLFPKTIDLMSDVDGCFLSKKDSDRLQAVSRQLQDIILSNPDISFRFWFGEREDGSIYRSLELELRDHGLYVGF